MRRLAEDDVQTRCYRVQMSLVDRPGLAQRSVSNIRELTSRVSSRDIPKYLDQLEIKFKAAFDPALGRHVTRWEDGEARSLDVVSAKRKYDNLGMRVQDLLPFDLRRRLMFSA